MCLVLAAQRTHSIGLAPGALVPITESPLLSVATFG